MIQNLIFIGMPGAGKSTLGKLLAQKLARPFCDTDALLEAAYHTSLQQMLDAIGYLQMREREAHTICAHHFPVGSVIATGGSVVYRDDAMQHLKRNGICIYLSAQLTTLQQRVQNLSTRGFNCAPGMDFEAVYRERAPLYQRYADVTIAVDGRDTDRSLAELDVALMGYLRAGASFEGD